MTIVLCPELNYLEAKERKARGSWHRWSLVEDAKLKELTGFNVATDLIAMSMGLSERTIRQRQRILGIKMVSGRHYKP